MCVDAKLKLNALLMCVGPNSQIMLHYSVIIAKIAVSSNFNNLA